LRGGQTGVRRTSIWEKNGQALERGKRPKRKHVPKEREKLVRGSGRKIFIQKGEEGGKKRRRKDSLKVEGGGVKRGTVKREVIDTTTGPVAWAKTRMGTERMFLEEKKEIY